MADIDPTVIKRTQETLGKFVKKPPLTEKLLKKPPFRFLHDVFNAVIKDTGYFAGLYTSDELNSENIKDRDDKMRFLQKMIDVIKIVTGVPITVRTSKIVAGQEPEKTNELLQLMGEVIEKKLDWKSAVGQVRTGKGVKDGKAQVKEKTHTKSKAQEKSGERISKDKGKEKDTKPTKDSKTKEAKGHTKTISPTTKIEKPKKSSDSKNKEKLVKSNKKSVEKSEIINNKTEVKQKSPPPVEMDVVKMESEASTVEHATEAVGKESLKSEQVKEISLEFSGENDIELEHQNSKILNEVQLQPPMETPPPKYDAVAQSTPSEVFRESEVRKSSAQRKSSSGKSRRSSANRVPREDRERERETPQHSISNNFESIHAVKEEKVKEIATKSSPTQPQQQMQTDNQLQTHVVGSNNNNNNNNNKNSNSNSSDVRRESTFTRENSKDSVMLTRENSKDSTNNVVNRPRTSLRPPSARPASARPGAPRRRDKNVEIILQPNDQIKMSGVNVKLEVFGDLDDDGENLVIIEDANAANITSDSTEGRQQTEENLEQQGHLVQQILETQKELMQQNGITRKNEKETDSSGSVNVRQSSARQMNNLRDVIQNLTKSVNPFGKLMDFIPEDIDAMQLEMTMWRDTYTQAANELRREKSLTESAIEPMKNQLVQIEANIKEYLEMIDTSRTKILQNSDKLLKMLTEQ